MVVLENRRYELLDEQGQDVSAKFLDFAKLVGLERAAPGRYSILLVMSLYGACKSGMQDPAKVVEEIRALEGLSEPSLLKAPIQNKYPPLKGLWHKHYLQDGLASMAMNLQKAMKRYGMPYFESRIQEAELSGEEQFVTADDIDRIVDDVVRGHWERLGDASSITGEWLLFAEYKGQRYYLAICTHDKDTHQHIRDCIDAVCLVEFPFLSEILCQE